MATLTINGQKVTVDDSFLSLSPDQQNATVEEIAKSLKPADTADAVNARAKAGIERAKAIQNGAPRTQIDPNTGQPAGVPAFSPNVYGTGDSAMAGLSNVGTFGFGDEAAAGLGSLISGAPYAQTLQEVRANQSKAQSENPGSYLAGQIGGGLAQAAMTGGAGFGANAAKSGGSLGRVALGSSLDGSLYGGAYGAGNANGDLTDRAKGALWGAGTGALVGGVAPYVAAGVGQGIKRLVSPFASSPEREAAVNALAQEGVPVTAGQRTGSKGLQYAESELGGRKAASLMEDQAAAFTDAAMRKAGGSGRATPDNLANLGDSLGQQFDALSSRNTMVADRQLAQDLGKTLNRYGRLLESQQKPIIDNLVNDIVTRVRAGGNRLSGEEYQAIRSDLSRAAQSTNNQTLKAAFKGLRDSLDNAMERSINPADLGAWKALRRQYGNYKVLERASTGGGADAGLGLISPAQLRVAASAGNRGGFARGASDFTDLAKAGQAVLTPLPNSGTAARSAVRNLGVPAGSAGLGSLVAGIPGAVVGAAAPYVAGRALLSAPVQRYLGNQVAATGANPVSNALLASLLRTGSLPAIERR
ncbi:hypothetical protein EN866_32905 [Mesorhizobium sp. M2D.F.Ca.ET.223.01.1.1]|uniref:hypothetical protein n=1 Tax=Mesorhizobium sp. M2D.F.Ca.ET.223.01.1.1 TaxID=2563940 RepID=UPI00109316F9|nr:hypothetical protein [Mesorhizobium sp. M2D.F.Ca.ET.223.01.1.1]TGR84608.1 hypothetical protein EN866_32905 [Mesorhizobium sp. M2D.F.Ca.ET.223.01.1.1]TGT64507.1 hypothetical protein EN802_32480 [bacterium M00.F.Ca.ET.159.01.1.1]TGT79352.1 hypothetical protein EN800_31820 [bacterium M00.F.Ca.ET.157.01.1.1]